MALQVPVASFETTITATISKTVTTIPLSSVTTDDGTTLTNGQVYSFIIDEGERSGNTDFGEETVTGTVDVAGLQLTSVTRGVSTVDGTTATAALQKKHRRGAKIKISDHPYLLAAIRALNGTDAVGGVMQNPASRSIDSNRDIVDKEYVDGVAAAAGGITAFQVTQNGADPSLTINIGAGRLVSGTEVVTYAGAAASAVTNNATNYVQVDWNGTTLINTTGFLEGYVPLAEVVTSGGDITSITDRRAWLTSNGANDKIITDRFTLGATIAVGNAVYVDIADAKWKLADADSAASATGKIGIALDAGVDTDTGKRVQIGGTVTGLSGLTAGWQYVSGTAGALTTTPGTNKKLVGYAPNTTTLILMDMPSIVQLEGGNSALTAAVLNEAATFFASTDITASEAETLTGGASSNADSLHTHQLAPGFQQINTGLAATLNCGQAAYDAATGNFYLAIKTTAGTSFDIYRFNIGTYSRTWQKTTDTVSSGSFDGAANGGLMVGATYVWLVGRATGGGDIRIVRFAKDLTGAQVMTISGTANTDLHVSVTGDDSTLYVKSATSSTRLAVYTISGTTATRGADISLTSGGDDMCIYDGSKFYSFAKGSPSSFRRYAFAGGAAEATITRHLAEADNLAINDGSGMSLIGFNSYNTNTFIVFLIHLEELGTTDRYVIDALLVDKT